MSSVRVQVVGIRQFTSKEGKTFRIANCVFPQPDGQSGVGEFFLGPREAHVTPGVYDVSLSLESRDGKLQGRIGDWRPAPVAKAA